jgi:hypothetical protein
MSGTAGTAVRAKFGFERLACGKRTYGLLTNRICGHKNQPTYGIRRMYGVHTDTA